MKRFILGVALLWSLCTSSFAQTVTFTDLKFSGSQIADTQWNVGSCISSTSSGCQIYSKAPGPTWNAGYPVYPTSTQYIAFTATGNSTDPWHMYLYNANGTVAQDLGVGHILSQGVASDGHHYFFFSNANYNGTLFSTDWGMNNSTGLTITGTMMPTVPQTNTFASTGSTAPLAAGQTAAPAGPPPPAPTAIYMNNATVKITRAIPTTNNSPAGEGPNNAFDNNVGTKYLNFDKKNAGVTVELNTGKAVTGFTVTTANDFSGRDPTSYKLYGSNDGSTWTLIKQDSITLSESRYTTSSVIDVANTTAYAYYFMLFPTTKAGDGCGLNCDSMQIAEITYYYDANSTATSTATNTTIVDPVTAAANTLCCGGSSAAFNADATNTAKVMSFVNRTTADSQVYIDQIGNSNTITVNQTGTRNNYVGYTGNGSFNDITITQSGTAATTANYTELAVVGNNNSVNIAQTSTGGSKGAFVSVNQNSNTLLIQQKDNGSHYAEVTLSGGNKNVDILQQGSASHMARINLSGQPTDLSLTQSGSTQQYYGISFNCATLGGCAKITVTQGQ